MTSDSSSSPSVPIRVGTAGWSYEDWNGIVYPEKPGRGFDQLGLMASLFDTNEINSTFYRIPDPRMTEGWARRVAHNPKFAFTAKLFRGFTHERKAGAAEEIEYARAIEPLASAGRLGCVLAQFPFSFRNSEENQDWLDGLLAKFHRLPMAVEFRHESWDDPAVLDLLSSRGAAFVNIDQPSLEGNLPGTSHVTATVAYFRFHGRNAPKWFGPDTSNIERYNYLYSDEELEPWIERLRQARKTLSEKGAADAAAKGVYAILNNHFRGQAVANALGIENRLTGRLFTAPESLRQTYAGVAAISHAPAAKQRKLF
ncbi:MAG TPA: DUF72 domain-containing protein [Thermoanaerobaculia bacterium]|nr:DUF72 domain-containing protein [Thermoanaerobaculia bacterium]